MASSSRHYPTADYYEERERDFYRPGRRRGTREFEELDLDVRHSSQPDFLREDYGRSGTAGPLVVRPPPPARPREIERDEVIIRDEHHERRPRRHRARSVEREEVTVRHKDRHRRAAEELDVTVRHEEAAHSPPRPRRRRELERDDFSARRSEPDLSRPFEHEEFTVRRGDRHRFHPRGVQKEEEVLIQHSEREGRGEERDRVLIRSRSRSRPPGPQFQPIARETEEYVIRRRRHPSPSPSPSPPRRVEKEEIIIRHTEERSPSPPPPPPPAPRPEPVILEPIIRPPIHQEIHQEIITHHRHIDHGVERARSPTPPPPPPRSPSPPPVKTHEIEVDITRRRGGREVDEQIVVRDRSLSRRRSRSRSRSRPRHHFDDELSEEADYYNRKAMERAFPGEGHHGATKDWTIVDVPPGTERVRMDGAGGSSQEITWQRYNGVRRSKFIAGDREFDTGFGHPGRSPSPIHAPALPAPLPLPPSRRDMWTEITKDLVIKEAIENLGYRFEETDYFYYVMEYLRYEDVLELVEESERIRYERRRRLREIEWERESLRRHGYYDGRGRNRYYEHEVIVDRRH